MRSLLRGAGALAAVIALTLGVPLLLVTWVGNPWPPGGWAEAGLLTDRTLLGLLAAVAWLLWAQMVACMVIETVAVVAGKRAGGIRIATGGQQRLARLLISSIAAAVAASGTLTPANAGAAPANVVADTAGHDPGAARLVDHRGPGDGLDRDRRGGRSLVVDEPSTAWRIAETRFGDGTRWREILALNRGVTMSDGTRFTQATQTIPAGTLLRLPTAGHSSSAGTRHQGPETPSPYTVRPGDTLWDISSQALDDPTRYPEIYQASQGIDQPGGGHLTDPDHIEVGWQLTIPNLTGATGHRHPRGNNRADRPAGRDGHTAAQLAGDDRRGQAPSPARPGDPGQRDLQPGQPRTEQLPTPQSSQRQPRQAPGDPAVDTTGQRSTGGQAEPVYPDTEAAAETGGEAGKAGKADEADEAASVLTASWALTGLTGGGVLLAGGLLLGLRRRRRAQFRARRPGRAITAPGPELAAAEMTITAAGSTGADPLVFLDTALRRLAGATHTTRGAMPAVAAVELRTGDHGRLTVHLSEPGDLPDPWQPTPDRLHWQVPTTLQGDALGPLSDEADPPYPLLVTVGAADTGELWLLNCEDLGVLTLTGDPDRARDFARHLVAQVAVNPWSTGVTVDCVGIAAEAQPLGDQVRHHASADAGAVIAEVLADAVAMVDRATRHHTDVATGRTGQADDDVWPSRLLLLDTGAEPPEHLAALLDLVEAQAGRTGTAVVLTGRPPENAGTELRLTAGGRVLLAHAGLDLAAVSLTSEETRGVGLIYAHSEVLDDTAIPTDATARHGWQAYADQAGALRREHTVPRGTPTSERAEPTNTLLEGDDREYLAHAPVLPEDLQSLAPGVPASLRAEVERVDPGLDRDYADWKAEDCNRARLSLLGPVTARTHGKPLPKQRAYFTELLAFLWFHRSHGASRDQIVTAFGTPPDRVRKNINILRDWLGTNPHTGQPYLPAADRAPAAQATGVNVYQLLDHGVLVDWDLFQRLRIRGQTRGGEEGRADLAKALGLVAGRPLDHLREGGWAWLVDGPRHDLTMPAAIADVALTLTTHLLVDGDLARARAATEVAALACPYEESTRLCLTQIAHAEGNQSEAQGILREHICNRTDDDQAPTDLNDRTQTIISDHDEWLAG